MQQGEIVLVRLDLAKGAELGKRRVVSETLARYTRK